MVQAGIKITSIADLSLSFAFRATFALSLGFAMPASGRIASDEDYLLISMALLITSGSVAKDRVRCRLISNRGIWGQVRAHFRGLPQEVGIFHKRVEAFESFASRSQELARDADEFEIRLRQALLVLFFVPIASCLADVPQMMRDD